MDQRRRTFFPDRPELKISIDEEKHAAALDLIHRSETYRLRFVILRVGHKNPKAREAIRNCRVYLRSTDNPDSITRLAFLVQGFHIPIHLSPTVNLGNLESVMAEIRPNVLQEETDVRPGWTRGFVVAIGLETKPEVVFATKYLWRHRLVEFDSPSKFLAFRVSAEADNADYTPSQEWFVLEVGRAWDDFRIRRYDSLSKEDKARVQWEK